MARTKERYARIVITTSDDGTVVEWHGDPSWPFYARHDFLMNGGLRLLAAYGPFEIVDQVSEDVFLMRRKA